MAWVEISGVPEAAGRLDAIAERATDLDPVIEGIHQAFMALEKARFDAEGPGWAPLAPSTVAAKARKGQSDRILVATGAMEASFETAGAEGHVFDVVPTGDGLTVEMGSEYRSPTQSGRWKQTALGAFHQAGTIRMPARPVIDFDSLDGRAVEWASLLSGWLTGTLSEAQL